MEKFKLQNNIYNLLSVFQEELTLQISMLPIWIMDDKQLSGFLPLYAFANERLLM